MNNDKQIFVCPGMGQTVLMEKGECLFHSNNTASVLKRF